MNWLQKTSAEKPTARDFVKTDVFKMWFGNSKVVDKNGNPLIVFKGMYPYDYSQEKADSHGRVGPRGPAIDTINRQTPFPSFDPKDQEPVHFAGFFTDSPQVASGFIFGEGAIFPVYLKIENPKIFDLQGKYSGTIQFGPEGKPFRDAIRSGRYDGVFILNTADEGNVYVPLLPTQIKSAIASKLDPNDPRFTH